MDDVIECLRDMERSVEEYPMMLATDTANIGAGARKLRCLGVTEVTCASKRPDLAGKIELFTEPFGARFP
jgi:hypothetical protein